MCLGTNSFNPSYFPNLRVNERADYVDALVKFTSSFVSENEWTVLKLLSIRWTLGTLQIYFWRL